jgi:flagellar hook protein FlgE
VETNLQEITIMLRSMFTAISSLGLHQKFLDVVSDNLANANTTGYKASRVLFQDQFAQLMSPGSGPSGDLGGVNPSQVGLGVKSGSIAPVFNQGVLQSTGRNFDVAINGDGFLIYNQGEERLYSRDGALDLDAAGYLVNSSTGARVQGWLADQTATPPIDTNNPVDSIRISRNGTLARATSNENLGGNLDSSTATNGKVITTMSVYDSLGEPKSVTVEFTRTGDNDWRWDITKNGTGTGTVTFDATGQYKSSTGTGSTTTASTVSIPTSAGATDPLVLQTLDLSKMTMTSGANAVSAVSQDGLPAGTISDVYVAPSTGEIFVFYTNGLKQLTGQLALARFANPSGLLRQGSNLYQVGANTGEPEVGTAGTGGRGSINSAYLEASNVDMAQEFTNMILAQRGFQASSRVITTSDEIMQELVNLKR